MAKPEGAGPQPPQRAARQDSVERAVTWIRAHRKLSTYGAAAVVLAAALFWWNVASTRRSEAQAGMQVNQARSALEAGNLPLAASELQRIVENYAGTRAAEHATILLAQVRLRQGQGEQAAALLRDFAPGASAAYRAQGYGLLGVAYENLGRPAEAAAAYREAARHARLAFLTANYLSDAGRAYATAGDTTRAVEAYREIIAEHGETGTAVEAKVRLGELTRGAGSGSGIS